MDRKTLDQDALDALAAQGRLTRFALGNMIYKRGEDGVSLLIVQSGQAEVSITSAAGRKSILHLAEEGDILGDIACLDGGLRSADVIAMTDVTAIVIDRPTLLRALRQNPDSALHVITVLCQKVRNASDMFEIQSLIDARARLAFCILRLIGEQDEPDYSGRIRVSQQWLGEYAGLSRENVNRNLRTLSDAGIVTIANGVLDVRDRSRLEDVVTSAS